MIDGGRYKRVNQQAASETQNESLGRAHNEAPKLFTIAKLISSQQTDFLLIFGEFIRSIAPRVSFAIKPSRLTDLALVTTTPSSS